MLHFVDHKLAQPVVLKPKLDPAARSIAKGLLAGLIGGLVATAAKSLAEKVYPPRIHGEPPPPDVLAEKLAGHPLDPATKEIASESIHWAFGAAAGAAYGALAEYYPAAAGREGATFGMTLMALTHNGALPALGLAADTTEQSSRERSSELVTHVIFGVVAETVRRTVRRAL
jgi:putative membrane protein